MGATRFLPVALALFCACGPEADVSSATTRRPVPAQITPVSHARGFEVTGGGLVVSPDGSFAAVSDPDGDRVWLVDLKPAGIRGRVALPKGSQPGRLALDPSGAVFVALRKTGQVARIDPWKATIVSTQDVCGDPRGLAWDDAARVVRVACASGELAEVPLEGPARVQLLRRDLRDVVPTAQGLKVTTLRAAEVLTPQTGSVLVLPQSVLDGSLPAFSARVAWRTVATNDGSLVIAHQRHVDGPVETLSPVQTAVPSYSSATSACIAPVVRSALTVVPSMGSIYTVALAGVTPVDVAVSPDGTAAAVAFAGSKFVELVKLGAANEIQRCMPAPGFDAIGVAADAVAWAADGTLVMHEPLPKNRLVVRGGAVVLLDGAPLADPGRDFFQTPVNGLACVSCHPEGRDDGHVWNVKGQARRTPSLASGVLQTAPFHWQGELPDISELVHDTFVTRMGGAQPSPSTVNEVANWIEGIPRPAAPRADLLDASAVAAGKALFEDSAVGCTSCHAGALLSSPGTVDVGTGGRFQVPSLRGVSARGPWLHDGRAFSLRARFAGTGDKHGVTSHLTPQQIDQLVAYLETL